MYMNECPADNLTCCSNLSCSTPGEITCIDCEDRNHLSCCGCFLLRHVSLPFHRILRWTGTSFKQESLYNIGHVIHLNHAGNACPHENTGSGLHSLTVMDTNGLHTVKIGWCCCADAPEHIDQLLTITLVPATVIRPMTAFTFRALKLFHMLTHVARVTPWEFCGTMMRLTDNVDTATLKVRFILNINLKNFDKLC